MLPPRLRSIHFPIHRQYSNAPNVAQTSFWLSLIPKPLRQSSPRAASKKKARSKEWNPATFFIVIFLLIGSMSIQMIALRNDFAAFSRRADAKIGLLKEIIERVQNGEEVDVEVLLGTGDKEREREWEEGKIAHAKYIPSSDEYPVVLQEIEREDQAWEQSKRTKPKRGEGGGEGAAAMPTEASPDVDSTNKTRQKTNAPSGFY
jgi:hypothetical protein